MRSHSLLAAAVAALASWGCSKPPANQAVDAFKQGVHQHFQNLNLESLARREELSRALAMAATNPALTPPSGTLLNTYTFDDTAFVVFNYKCKTCETRTLLATPSAEYLCRTCGHSPYVTHPAVNFDPRKSPCETCLGSDGKPKAPSDAIMTREFFAKEEGCVVKPMWEMAEGQNPEKPMRAKVRYVRRQMSFDARGVVSAPAKAVEKAGSDVGFIPTGGEVDPSDPRARYQRAGYHRLDAVYVGELEFEYRGGDVSAVTRPREEGVRPWKDLRKS
jgi:hypothetical protein